MATMRSSLAFVVICAVSAGGCGDAVDFGDGERVEGSGDLTTESRSVGDFDRIVLAGEGRVVFATAPDDIVEIETDDNLIPRIETDVSGATLTISTESGTDIEPTEGVVYRVGCPESTGAILSGAGSIDLAGCASDEVVELVLSGAGDIRAPDLDVSQLTATVSGAGSVIVVGVTDRLELEVSGAGSFHGGDLEASDATVVSSGVGSIELWVTRLLGVEVSGVGTVGYYGQPTVNQTVTGVGSVTSLGSR